MDSDPNGEAKRHSTERKLGHSWCVWEKYQTAFIQNTTNYQENIEIIYTFDTMDKFAMLWKYTTYNHPSELFFDIETNATKKFRISDEDPEEKIVDGLLLFREGVLPKWEDPANHKGCSISCDLNNMNGKSIDKVWKDILFAVIGQNFPFSDCVNGFRLLDRLKKHNLVKLELWMSCGVGACKPESEAYKQNKKVVDAITEYTHSIINRTQEVAFHSIFKKEHYIASKVN